MNNLKAHYAILNESEALQKDKSSENLINLNSKNEIHSNNTNNNNLINLNNVTSQTATKNKPQMKSHKTQMYKVGIHGTGTLTHNNPSSSNIINPNIQKNQKFSLKNLKRESESKIKVDISDFIEFEEEKSLELTADEKIIYGNREPKNYKKVKLLGKGGCGMVWLCKNSNEQLFAAKQITKKVRNEPQAYSINAKIGKREIELLSFISDNNNDSENNSIIKLIESQEDNSDVWLIFERAGKSLSNLMFKIKGEFMGNERIYLIQKGKFLGQLFENIENFKFFFKQMLLFIKNINQHDLIHCDIKPENILIDYEYDEDSKLINYKSFKVIDFGSAFHIDNPDNFASNTPEYMSPEITDLIEKNASNKEITNFLKNLKSYPWVIDIWSLAVMILEILLCCPLWMNYKAKITLRGKTVFRNGLFGVKGRDGNRIYNKQLEVGSSIPKLFSFIIIEDEKEKDKLADLLMRMLDVNYKNRISPEVALIHEFFS